MLQVAFQAALGRWQEVVKIESIEQQCTVHEGKARA
jgi:uncharacterized protein (UPF0179 family)